MKNKFQTAIIITVICPFLLISGCKSILPEKQAVNPLRYYRYPGTNMADIGKVVILELGNESMNPSIGKEMTEALTEEIQKKQVFGLDTLTKNDPEWKSVDIGKHVEIADEKLSEINQKLNADAVLFGKITNYRPYPRNSIGLKLKLVDCQTSQLLWAIDQVWDSTDIVIENRIKSFFKKHMRSGYDPLEWKVTMLSPRIYNKFIAYEVSKTLE